MIGHVRPPCDRSPAPAPHIRSPLSSTPTADALDRPSSNSTRKVRSRHRLASGSCWRRARPRHRASSRTARRGSGLLGLGSDGVPRPTARGSPTGFADRRGAVGEKRRSDHRAGRVERHVADARRTRSRSRLKPRPTRGPSEPPPASSSALPLRHHRSHPGDPRLCAGHQSDLVAVLRDRAVRTAPQALEPVVRPGPTCPPRRPIPCPLDVGEHRGGRCRRRPLRGGERGARRRLRRRRPDLDRHVVFEAAYEIARHCRDDELAPRVARFSTSRSARVTPGRSSELEVPTETAGQRSEQSRVQRWCRGPTEASSTSSDRTLRRRARTRRASGPDRAESGWRQP